MRLLLALVFCVAAAGCGAVLQPPQNASSALVAEPQMHDRDAASRQYVFTCQNGTVFDCLVYNIHGKLQRTLTNDVDSPLGVAAGKDGRLYVANAFADNVLVYSAGGKSLLSELENNGNVPIDVAVFNDALAVSNEHVLTYFASGVTEPTRTLRDSNVLQGNGVAFDADGNCYWSFSKNTGNGNQVDEFTGCNGSPQTINVQPGFPYGMAFDGSGNLYYTSFSSSDPGVYRCSGTSSCQKLNENLVDPEYLNFSNGFGDLWVNDPGNISGGTALVEIDVATGKVIRRVSAGLTFDNPPSGVAAAPGAF